MPVITMMRRLFLMVFSLSALPTSFTKPPGIGASWARRVLRSWKLSVHLTRLAALFRRAALRPWQELPRRPAGVETIWHGGPVRIRGML